MVYSRNGDGFDVADRPLPEPGAGEVRVRVQVSGVNPTDWKARSGIGSVDHDKVPNQDGAGIVDAVGDAIQALDVGQRVWLWEAAWQRDDGTAQQFVVVPERQAVALPDDASLDLGASLGIPALTAHRALTVADGGPDQLSPGALAGRTVLVAGGAGAVGHAAIQLARWAGAEVVTTVSSPEKADLARRAGAQHVVNYRTGDTAEQIRAVAPDGINIVVEVSPAANAELNAAVVARNAVVAMYADNGGSEITLPVRPNMAPNTRYQFILVYTVDPAAKDHAVQAVSAAVRDGALPVGEQAGLPLHRFPLERTTEAHAAVRSGVVGKVLIDVQ
jgi:NADPH2:quinone reductase